MLGVLTDIIGIGRLVWTLSELFRNLRTMCCNDVYLVFNNMFTLIIGKSQMHHTYVLT